jgi:hypothetical protein
MRLARKSASNRYFARGTGTPQELLVSKKKLVQAPISQLFGFTNAASASAVRPTYWLSDSWIVLCYRAVREAS